MQFPAQPPGRSLTTVCRATVKRVARLITIVWRAHGDLLDRSLVYRAVMILVAEAILARVNLGDLLQVIADLLHHTSANSPNF